jgi:hypothetical protein
MPADRLQASPVGVRELEAPLTQLASNDAVLFHQIRDRLPLLAIQPGGEDGEHHVESRRVDHRESLRHAAKSDVWPCCGQYKVVSTFGT